MKTYYDNKKNLLTLGGASIVVILLAAAVASTYAINLPNLAFAQPAQGNSTGQNTATGGSNSSLLKGKPTQTSQFVEKNNNTGTNMSSSGNASGANATGGNTNNATTSTSASNNTLDSPQRLHALLDATIVSIKNNDVKATMNDLYQLMQGLSMISNPNAMNQTTITSQANTNNSSSASNQTATAGTAASSAGTNQTITKGGATTDNPASPSDNPFSTFS